MTQNSSLSNHEKWATCPTHGDYDRRFSDKCPDCKHSKLKTHHSTLFYIFVILLTLTSCSTSKQAPHNTQYPTLNTPSDSCMTDKQYRMRLAFVKDSLQIEAKNQKREIKYEYRYHRDSIYLEKVIYKFDTKRFNDSLNTIKSMYKDSMRASVPIAKAQEKTNRTDIRKTEKTERSVHRQEEKTKRSKWWVWLVVGFAGGIAISNVKFRPF